MTIKWMVLTLALCLAACSGTDGTDGADGAQGPAGAQGEEGEPGADGAPGVDGTDGMNGADGMMGPEGPQGPAGEPGEDAPIPGPLPTPPVIGTVQIQMVSPPSNAVTLDIVGFDFSVTNQWTFASGGGASAGKPQFEPLFLSVAASEDVAVLQSLFYSNQITSIELTLAGDTTPTITSSFSAIAMVEPRPERADNQSYLFDVVVDLADVTVRRGSAEASWDAVTNTGSCTNTPCGCNQLTPLTYVQTGAQMLTLPAGVVEIDTFSTGVERTNTFGSGSGGGGSVSKLVDSGTQIDRDFGEDALCDFVSATSSTSFDGGLTIHHASPLSTQFGPLYDHSVELLCLSVAESVRIYSDAGELRAETLLRTGAQTQTFRTFDATDGSEISSTSNTWNFQSNNMSTTCL